MSGHRFFPRLVLETGTISKRSSALTVRPINTSAIHQTVDISPAVPLDVCILPIKKILEFKKISRYCVAPLDFWAFPNELAS